MSETWDPDCERTVFVNSPLGPNWPWCDLHDRPWETCFAAKDAEIAALRAENAKIREALQTLIDEDLSIAEEWRHDWSDFDGRTLLYQIDATTSHARRALGARSPSR